LADSKAKVPFYKWEGFKTGMTVVVTLLIAYGMANLEILRRAHNSYERGEAHYAQKEYKQALWDYQEVQEFYYLPHNKWVDLAAEKEFLCRAYLGDWVPPEGPLDADIRTTRPDYPKYQAEVAVITPVGDTSYTPVPTFSIKVQPSPSPKR
jgi:hypothetical protein